METIGKRQRELLGKICRRKGLEHQSLTGKTEGKRGRGRQRTTHSESLRQYARIYTINDCNRSVMETIGKRQREFLWQIGRRKGLEHQPLTGKREGKRGRGRQRTTQVETLRRYARIYKINGCNRSLMETIGKRQWEFLGQICWRKGFKHQLLTGKTEGKRGRGRQRTTHIESLRQYARIYTINDCNRLLMETLRNRQRELLGKKCWRKGLEDQLLTGKREGKRGRGRQRTTHIESLRRLKNEKNAGIFIQKADDRENCQAFIVNICNQIRRNNGIEFKSSYKYQTTHDCL